MKKLAKSLVIVSALAVAGSAVAEFGDITPYVGADYQQAWTKNSDAYKGSMAKSFPGATLYVGSKFHENFGVELGYSMSKTKSKINAEKDKFDGDQYKAGAIKTKLRRSTAFLDLVGFLPVMDGVELIGSVGYGLQKPKLTLIEQLSGATADRVKLKSKGTARVGLGASYMLTDMVGLRAKLGWENTSSIKFKDAKDYDNPKPFKNTTTFNFGAFVKF